MAMKFWFGYWLGATILLSTMCEASSQQIVTVKFEQLLELPDFPQQTNVSCVGPVGSICSMFAFNQYILQKLWNVSRLKTEAVFQTFDTKLSPSENVIVVESSSKLNDVFLKLLNMTNAGVVHSNGWKDSNGLLHVLYGVHQLFLQLIHTLDDCQLKCSSGSVPMILVTNQQVMSILEEKLNTSVWTNIAERVHTDCYVDETKSLNVNIAMKNNKDFDSPLKQGSINMFLLCLLMILINLFVMCLMVRFARKKLKVSLEYRVVNSPNEEVV